jgi:hypothetical protein
VTYLDQISNSTQLYHDNLPVSSTAGVGGIPLTGVSGRLADRAFSQLGCRRRSPLSSAVGLSLVSLSGVTDFGVFLGCFFGCLPCPKRQPLLFSMLFLAALSRSLMMWAAMESPG